MIKLQDFARQMGVTDRAIQKHLKKYAAELEGLYQRKGPNGTWLTEEACEILRNKMRQQPMAVADSQIYRDLEEAKKKIEKLQDEKANLATMNAILSDWKADNAVLIAGAEQNRLLLESTKAELDQERQAHAKDNADKDQIIASKDAEIQEVRASAQREAEARAVEAEKAAKREQDAVRRAEAAEAKLAEFESLPFWRKPFWKGK